MHPPWSTKEFGAGNFYLNVCVLGGGADARGVVELVSRVGNSPLLPLTLFVWQANANRGMVHWFLGRWVGIAFCLHYGHSSGDILIYPIERKPISQHWTSAECGKCHTITTTTTTTKEKPTLKQKQKWEAPPNLFSIYLFAVMICVVWSVRRVCWIGEGGKVQLIDFPKIAFARPNMLKLELKSQWTKPVK